ncbi:MAG: PilZ domain-containing protein [Deltaproteobacteria bacterium]|nr:MAG: PilZ domain-containing protein [Deltaproteobacteria bacterium]
MKSDRRAYPRGKYKWPVVFKTDKNSVSGVTVNVGPDGVFVRCQSPSKLNEVGELTITIPDSKHSIKAKAEVVWSNIYGPDDEISPRGMGVRFLRISSEDRKFIATAVLGQLKSLKVKPELLDTLSTLIIDLSEDK